LRNPPSLGVHPSSRPIEFVIMTTGSYADLQEYVDKISTASRTADLTNLDTDLKLNNLSSRLKSIAPRWRTWASMCRCRSTLEALLEAAARSL
jgi:hypothetical protein